MTASSSFSPASVGAENGRLGTERGGGAWCPANLISRDNSGQEWLEVDLGRDTMVTGVITQGRSVNRMILSLSCSVNAGSRIHAASLLIVFLRNICL